MINKKIINEHTTAVVYNEHTTETNCLGECMQGYAENTIKQI